MHRNMAVFLVILLSACLSQDENVLRQIKPGITDKDTVRGILGAPVNQSRAGGEEMWLFYITNGSSMPYFGAASTTRMVQVYFTGNVVSRCWVANANSNIGPLPAPNSNANGTLDCAAS